MEGSTFIYILVEPESSLVRYVGKSNNPAYRYNSHCSEKFKIKENGKCLSNRKVSWIKSLKTKGLKPELLVIDEVPTKEWQFWETYYISLYRSWGFNLVNIRDGGCGHDGLRGENNPAKRPEVREKIRKAKLGPKNAMYGKNPWNKDTKGICKINSTSWVKGRTTWNKGLTKENSLTVLNNANNRKGLKYKVKSKPVLQCDLSGNVIEEWDTIKEAYKNTGISRFSIRMQCKGRTLKYKPEFIWKYK